MYTSMSTYVTRFGHFVFGNPTTSPMGDSTLSPLANVCEPRTLHSEASRVNEQSSRQHAAPKEVVATDIIRLVCHRHGTLGPLPPWSSGPAQHPGGPGRRRAPPQGARRGWFARRGIVAVVAAGAAEVAPVAALTALAPTQLLPGRALVAGTRKQVAHAAAHRVMGDQTCRGPPGTTLRSAARDGHQPKGVDSWPIVSHLRGSAAPPRFTAVAEVSRRIELVILNGSDGSEVVCGRGSNGLIEVASTYSLEAARAWVEAHFEGVAWCMPRLATALIGRLREGGESN